MKSILSIFLVVVLLSVFSNVNVTYGQTVTKTIVKTSVQYKNSSNWKEAYYKALLEEYPKDSERIGLTVRQLLLQDVDLDGIPELFLVYTGVVNSVIFHGYHFKAGKVTDINIPDDGIPINLSLSLWKNKKTSKFIWLAEASLRNGPISYTNIYNLIDFSNLSSVKKSVFWAYDTELSQNADNPRYFYYLDDKNKKEMPIKDIENKLKEKLAPFQKINAIHFTSLIDEFLTDGYDLSKDNLDKNKLMKFFSKWTYSNSAK